MKTHNVIALVSVALVLLFTALAVLAFYRFFTEPEIIILLPHTELKEAIDFSHEKYRSDFSFQLTIFVIVLSILTVFFGAFLTWKGNDIATTEKEINSYLSELKNSPITMMDHVFEEQLQNLRSKIIQDDSSMRRRYLVQLVVNSKAGESVYLDDLFNGMIFLIEKVNDTVLSEMENIALLVSSSNGELSEKQKKKLASALQSRKYHRHLDPVLDYVCEKHENIFIDLFDPYAKNKSTIHLLNTMSRTNILYKDLWMSLFKEQDASIRYYSLDLLRYLGSSIELDREFWIEIANIQAQSDLKAGGFFPDLSKKLISIVPIEHRNDVNEIFAKLKNSESDDETNQT